MCRVIVVRYWDSGVQLVGIEFGLLGLNGRLLGVTRNVVDTLNFIVASDSYLPGRLCFP